MEHLLNCHGEWAAVAAFLSAMPFLRTVFGACRKQDSRSDHSEVVE
jgi:hypothetical protein